MKYSYTARTKEGELKKGTIEAPTREDAEKSLLEQDLIVVFIGKYKKRAVNVGAVPFIGGVSSMNKIFFTRHLTALIGAGISLTEALEVLSGETKSSSFKTVINDVAASIRNGNTLSHAMSRHPKVFDRLYVHVVGIGEQSGTLEENLEYIVTQLEKARDLKQKLIAAMIYPAIIFFLAVFIAAGLIVFILPRLLPVFASFDVELPLTTKVLIGISSFFENYGFIAVGAFVGALILIRVLAIVPSVNFILARMALVVPIFGPIVRNLNLAFLSRTMETLIRSGVSMSEALEITSDSLGNAAYRRKLHSFMGPIKEGRGLGTEFEAEESFFPTTFSRMVSVGERSGGLEKSFNYLAVFYEKEVDNLTNNLSNILQPVLLVVVGFVVGFIAIAIVTPIYKFTESIGR